MKSFEYSLLLAHGFPLSLHHPHQVAILIPPIGQGQIWVILVGDASVYQLRQDSYHLTDVANVARLILKEEHSIFVPDLLLLVLFSLGVVLSVIIKYVLIAFGIGSQLTKAYLIGARGLIFLNRDQVIRGLVEGSFLSIENLEFAPAHFLQEQIVTGVQAVKTRAMSFD